MEAFNSLYDVWHILYLLKWEVLKLQLTGYGNKSSPMWEVLEAFLTSVSILSVWLILPTSAAAAAAWQYCIAETKFHGCKGTQIVWTQKGEGLI